MRFDSGYTRKRSMERFRCRAPYLKSIPSSSRKLLAASLGDSSLNRPQLDLQNLGQVFAVQAAEDHDLIDPVHEFRREFTLRGFERRPKSIRSSRARPGSTS